MAEFLTMYVVFVLGLVSPGPDFAVTIKNSLHSRGAVLFTAMGIAAGLVIHMAYIIGGMGVVIAKSPTLFLVIKYMGAAYLFWIGFQALRSKKIELHSSKKEHVGSSKESWSFFREGFLVNLLNPKATLFFLSLFSQVVDFRTPKWILSLYGIAMILTAFCWFTAIGWALTGNRIKRKFAATQHKMMRVMGALLILIAIQIFWD